VAKLVDAADSKSAALKSVSVRVRPLAPIKSIFHLNFSSVVNYQKIISGGKMAVDLDK
jgi:hypothetical protein